MTLANILEQVFRDCFYATHRTRLVGGAAEPLYLPAQEGRDAMIFYREDYPASALHEVAHWCIAGADRRCLEDYGYWYAPDGRSAAQQRAFEWHLALASGVAFTVSADNLAAPLDSSGFAAEVADQARRFCHEPLPPRAESYRAALAACLGGVARPSPETFGKLGQAA